MLEMSEALEIQLNDERRKWWEKELVAALVARGMPADDARLQAHERLDTITFQPDGTPELRLPMSGGVVRGEEGIAELARQLRLKYRPPVTAETEAEDAALVDDKRRSFNYKSF